MAITSAQIDARIDALTLALGNPRLKVVIDGQEVSYRSIADIQAAISALKRAKAELTPSTDPGLGIRIFEVEHPNSRGGFST